MQAFIPGSIVCSELLPSPIGWFWNESPQHWWSIRHELGCLIIIPQNDIGASNSQTDEELDVSMAQPGMFLRNWGCFASNSSLGGLLGMALDDRGLIQLPSEARGKKHVQISDRVPRTVPRTVPGLCLKNTHWDTDVFTHALIHLFINNYCKPPVGQVVCDSFREEFTI